MRTLSVILLLSLFGVAASAGEVVERTVLNGKVTLDAPAEFLPMSEEMLDYKYPAERRPSEVLCDSTGAVSLAFNHTATVMRQDQVIEAHKGISEAFHNMYPSATWLRDETIVRDGANFMVLELVTPAMDTEIHNIIYGTSVDGRFLLVAFNTTIEESGKWLPLGKKIMESIKLQR